MWQTILDGAYDSVKGNEKTFYDFTQILRKLFQKPYNTREIIMNLFKWYIDKKEHEEAKLKKLMKEAKRSAVRDILKANEEMLSKKCPFKGMSNCVAECVHFKEGSISYNWVGIRSIQGVWTRKWPECRLWSDRHQ